MWADWYPNSSSTGSKSSDKERADRYEKALKETLALPLPQRVAYVYQGIIKDALKGDK